MACGRSYLARHVQAASLSPREEEKVLRQLSVPAPDIVPLCKAMIGLGRSAALTSTALVQRIAQLLAQPPVPEIGLVRRKDAPTMQPDEIRQLWGEGEALFNYACNMIARSSTVAHGAKAALTQGARGGLIFHSCCLGKHFSLRSPVLVGLTY